MADDYLATADVWTVLDLIVAEWESDAAPGAPYVDPRLRARAKVLVDARRKQSNVDRKDEAFAVLTQAFSDYLESIGWMALVAGNPQIRGVEQLGIGKYEFALQFTGGRRRPVPDIIVPPGGASH